MSFCDFCECRSCRTGDNDFIELMHAPTSDGRWICDVCYTYDVCTSGPQRNQNGPCSQQECVHRPLLTSEFRKKETK